MPVPQPAVQARVLPPQAALDVVEDQPLRLGEECAHGGPASFRPFVSVGAGVGDCGALPADVSSVPRRPDPARCIVRAPGHRSAPQRAADAPAGGARRAVPCRAVSCRAVGEVMPVQDGGEAARTHG
ncbi:hypothetical protein GCM10025734_71940 [Kitasatospora paranensis]